MYFSFTQWFEVDGTGLLHMVIQGSSFLLLCSSAIPSGIAMVKAGGPDPTPGERGRGHRGSTPTVLRPKPTVAYFPSTLIYWTEHSHVATRTARKLGNAR